MGGWMPESGNRYELFSREYYWSSAFDFFKKDYYGHKEWRKIREKNNKNILGNVVVTGGQFARNKDVDWLDISGVYYFKAGKLTGEINCF